MEKKEALLQVNNDVSKNDLISLIKDDINLKKYLNKKNIVKSIYIQNKLINLIVN